MLPPVPAPALAGGRGEPAPGTQVVGPLAQSATALHISTRLVFPRRAYPPRGPIIVSVTSPSAAR
jgi:hypothetical protein